MIILLTVQMDPTFIDFKVDHTHFHMLQWVGSSVMIFTENKNISMMELNEQDLGFEHFIRLSTSFMNNLNHDVRISWPEHKPYSTEDRE